MTVQPVERKCKHCGEYHGRETCEPPASVLLAQDIYGGWYVVDDGAVKFYEEGATAHRYKLEQTEGE